MTHTDYTLATHPFHLALRLEEQRLRLTQFGLSTHPWLHPAHTSRLFAVVVNGRRYEAANLDFIDLTTHHPAPGVTRHTLRFKSRLFTLEQHIQLYDDLALVETWPVITALKPCRLSRLDAFSLDLQADDLQLHYYSSAWGAEFEPHSRPCDQRITLQTRRGRASNGMHPWFELVSAQGQVLAGSVAWSGNWVLRFQPVAGGILRLSGGVHNWAFEKTLQPGERLESPPGILALGEEPMKPPASLPKRAGATGTRATPSRSNCRWSGTTGGATKTLISMRKFSPATCRRPGNWA
jgi:alpha-galactosidase